MEPRQKLNVVVTGGTDAQSAALDLAFAIGYEVVRRKHILLNGGAKGVDRYAVHGADKYLQEVNLRFDSQVIAYCPGDAPQPASSRYTEVRVVGNNRAERRDEVVRDGDVLIVLSGDSGTLDMAKRARNYGKPVIPVGCSRGTALELWHDLIADDGKKYPYRAQLTTKALQSLNPTRYAVGDVARVAVDLAEQVTGSDKIDRSTGLPTSTSQFDLIRIQHLKDNIEKDLILLKEYEDVLRVEDDPRRRARYRYETEKLRESAARYRQEYNELGVQALGGSSTELQGIGKQLKHMDAKLDVLLSTQGTIRNELKELREAMLVRFDASEQVVIAAVLERLDQNQLAIVQTVLDALESGRVAESELQDTLMALQQLLAEIRERKTTEKEPALSAAVERVSEAVAAPTLDVKHKLKIAAPIIPMVLSYEGEIDLGSRLDLEATWKRLIAKIRGGR